MNTKKFVFLALILAPSIGSAISFGEPVLNGPGCSLSSVSWALSPNNNSLSILLAGFQVNANAQTGVKRSNCEIVTQVTVANQTLVQADYRGFYDLPASAISTSRVTYVLDSREVGSKLDSNLGDEVNTYTHSQQVNFSCVGTYTLKIIAEALVSSSATDRNASYSLDSIDLGANTGGDNAIRVCSSAAQVGWLASGLISLVVAFLSI